MSYEAPATIMNNEWMRYAVMSYEAPASPVYPSKIWIELKFTPADTYELPTASWYSSTGISSHPVHLA